MTLLYEKFTNTLDNLSLKTGNGGVKQKKSYDLDENSEKIPVIDKKTGQQKVEKRNSVSGKHQRRISGRTAFQSAGNAEKYITTRKMDRSPSLTKFTADKEQKYQQFETVHLSTGQKLNQ